MKLRKGKPRYKIPAHSDIIGVYVEGNQKHNQMCHYALQRVALEELPNIMHLGMPALYSVLHEIIEFSPPPDKPYVVKVRYTPPVQEF